MKPQFFVYAAAAMFLTATPVVACEVGEKIMFDRVVMIPPAEYRLFVPSGEGRYEIKSLTYVSKSHCQKFAANAWGTLN